MSNSADSPLSAVATKRRSSERRIASAASISTARRHRPTAVLIVVLLSVFVINLDSSIVNVALPSLSRELSASTSSLQWFVDAYNLSLAALVLAAGTTGDRYGRRGTLAAGLALFAASSVAAALCTSSGQLIAARFIMGAGAALIFPTTLSIITTTFADRSQRSAAIGAWAAVTGVGVAVGPVVGGALLAHFWWGIVFISLVPIALIALGGTIWLIPGSRASDAPSLDWLGLLLSVATLGVLVHSVIEAPNKGWLARDTVGGFVLAVLLGVLFVAVEQRSDHPMVELSLFANPRFSAASGAVTIAFFALFGFSFLVTQYFQQLRGYTPLGTGVRVLPIAGAIAASSVLGAKLAVLVGNKLVVTSGLVLMAAAFCWISFVTATTGYGVVAMEMVLLGGGLGFTSAPATEAIMGVVRPEQAGAGSAVNDATRELGGTLGVAVLGSIFSSLYAGALSSSKLPDVAESLRKTAQSGMTAGLNLVSNPPGSLSAASVARLRVQLDAGFLSGLHAGCWVATGLCLLGALAVLLLLPSRPNVEHAR